MTCGGHRAAECSARRRLCHHAAASSPDYSRRRGAIGRACAIAGSTPDPRSAGRVRLAGKSRKGFDPDWAAQIRMAGTATGRARDARASADRFDDSGRVDVAARRLRAEDGLPDDELSADDRVAHADRLSDDRRGGDALRDRAGGAHLGGESVARAIGGAQARRDAGGLRALHGGSAEEAPTASSEGLG